MTPIRETIARAIYNWPGGDVHDAADAVLRAIEAEGWRVVPAEPTEAILGAGFLSLGRPGGPVAAKWMDSRAMLQDADHAYRAMLAAAPKVTE